MLITCPECKAEFRAHKEVMGKKAKCGHCEHVFTVPQAITEHIQSESAESSFKQSAPVSTKPDDLTIASLYLAAMAVGLLLVRSSLGGLIANLLVSLATETAATFFVWRGFRNAQLARTFQPQSHLARTGFLVNLVLLAVLGMSVLLTIYQLMVGQPSSGIPGMGDLMKMLQQQHNQADDILKGIK